MNLIVVSRKKLNRLKCGKEKARKLVSTGITQVVELSSPRRTKEEVAKSICQISEETHLPTSAICCFHRQALTALYVTDPSEVNHLTTKNTYQLCYSEEWEEKQRM